MRPPHQLIFAPPTGRICLLLAVVIGCLVPDLLEAQKEPKPKKEELTQTLQLPRELPATVTGDTRRLTFHVPPLSGRGLLSAQVRDGLKTLLHETGGSTVLHLRAFVAGSGDLRRVRDLVSEVFTDHRLPLPALSLVRAGGLPVEGAQVALEAIAAGKKDVNPMGLGFFAAPVATAADPLGPAAPLAAQSLAGLRRALAQAGGEPADVLRLTCYLSTLEDLPEVRKLVYADYPRTAVDFIQPKRSPAHALAACEAVARLRRDPGRPLTLPATDSESLVALIAAPRIVLTGTQASYGYEEANSRLAFERTKKALAAGGASEHETAVVRCYALAEPLAAQARKLRADFFGGAPGTCLPFEGLPAMDAGFAIDVVAVAGSPK
jgi:enamine deaminase RidA (YjgF/YER057c/UK114 family)